MPDKVTTIFSMLLAFMFMVQAAISDVLSLSYDIVTFVFVMCPSREHGSEELPTIQKRHFYIIFELD